MAKRNRKNNKNERCCETCGNRIELGGGDIMCDKYSCLVIDDYMPADNYLECGGSKWTR